MQLLDNGCLPVDDRFGLLGFDDNGDLGCFRLWLGDVLLEPLEKCREVSNGANIGLELSLWNLPSTRTCQNPWGIASESRSRHKSRRIG